MRFESTAKPLVANVRRLQRLLDDGHDKAVEIPKEGEGGLGRRIDAVRCVEADHRSVISAFTHGSCG